MIGCRPLTTDEVERVNDKLDERDKAIFMVGLKAGFRVSEILSLKVRDVLLPDGSITTSLSVERQNMKGKKAGRTVALHHDARLALERYLKSSTLDASGYLFPGPSGNPLSRVQVWRCLKAAYAAAGVFGGKLATHSMRKTFADRVYKRLKGDLRKTQEALGHKVITSTASYVGFANAEVDEAILGAS